MISELSFSRKFTSFWNGLIPGCEAYVRLINQGLITRCAEPIDLEEEISNRALINGVGFSIFRKIVNNELRLEQLPTIEQSGELQTIINAENDFLLRFSGHSRPTLPFLDTEVKSIKEIANRLYVRYGKRNTVVIAPLFPGCGIINAAQGDIWSDNTLVEVKAGERNFSVYDIRQLLIYCALNFQGNGPYIIERVELFNPRIGVCFIEDINELSRNVGSMSSYELYSEIITYITEGNFVEPS